MMISLGSLCHTKSKNMCIMSMCSHLSYERKRVKLLTQIVETEVDTLITFLICVTVSAAAETTKHMDMWPISS